MIRSATLRPSGRTEHPWWYIAAAAAVLLVVISAAHLINAHWPFRYRNVEPLLEKVFASQIKIDHYHRIYLPNPGFVADGLTLRRNSAPDLPPVGSAEHLRVEGSWMDLLLFRRRVRLVYVDGLHVVIPPVGSRANKEDFPPGSSADFTGPTTAVERLDITKSVLDIMRADGSRYSFPVHHLVIGNLRKGQAVSYMVDMHNARPSGRIEAHGSFGPLLARQLPSTPVSGEFTYGPATLADIHGISGMMSARGSFHGTLADIEAAADSTTPDFAVGHGRATAVTAGGTGVVNGLNGDVLLRSVEAHTGGTTVHAQGGILGSPAVTNLDLSVSHGRAEDILRPFMRGPVPVKGAVRLHSHAYIAPSENKEKFLDRLRMDGVFDIPAERLTNASTQQKLSAFSQRAQDPKSAGAGDDASDVLSGIHGDVSIRHGIVYPKRLIFEVPGASVALNGTFDLRNQNAHLLGDLHMQSDISHATTGYKSVLLKPFAPLFKKQGAGAVVAIAITGSPHHYKVGQNVLHRK